MGLLGLLEFLGLLESLTLHDTKVIELLELLEFLILRGTKIIELLQLLGIFYPASFQQVGAKSVAGALGSQQALSNLGMWACLLVALLAWQLAYKVGEHFRQSSVT